MKTRIRVFDLGIEYLICARPWSLTVSMFLLDDLTTDRHLKTDEDPNVPQTLAHSRLDVMES